MNKICLNLIIAVILSVVVLLPYPTYANNNPEGLYYGKSVEVENDRVTIDMGFLNKLSKQPTYRAWLDNYWELIYFILLDHPVAISIGIDLLGSEDLYLKVAMIENIGDLARPLSQSDLIWNVLREKPKKTILNIIKFYDVNSKYWAGYNYEKEKNIILNNQ